MAKVSIVIPIYNVEKYLRQCLDSVVNQTLTDIEIICVNDGSKDSSLAIMQEYAAKDARVKIIDKPNSGYGNSMNRGFDMAEGEYIGIVESDDYADADMFETLYRVAKEEDADVVKGGFYYYFSKPEETNEPAPIASHVMCSRTFCPTRDFKERREMADFFNIKPTIWSAIYRRDFIRSEGIRFNETPGASYQDLSFTFKVWALAQRVRLVERCFLHYRQDNEQSSVNSPGKVYCVYDEYCEISRFLDTHPTLKGKLEGIKNRLKYDSYMWNYERLAPELGLEFIKFASEDLAKDMQGGFCERELYPWYKWNTLNLIIEDWEKFVAQREEARAGNAAAAEAEDVKRPNVFVRGWRCVREHGVGYTVKRFFAKLGGRK